MNSVKKAAVLSGAVLSALLAGMTVCAEEPAITLDVILCEYGPNTRDWFLGSGMDGTNFVEKFEKENPDIRLNLDIVTWTDIYAEVDTRIANNNTPDILNTDVFTDYASQGLLVPVSYYCTEELYEDIFPDFLEQSELGGSLWALPNLASARALFINADLFEEAGLEEAPQTWSELEECCETILTYFDGEVYPWGIDMTMDEGQAAFAYYTWGNGGGFVDEDGSWDLNSAENVQALDFAAGLVNQGYTNPSPATQTRYDLQDLFAEGKLAMVIAPNSLPTYVAERGEEMTAEAWQIPAADGKTASSVGVMDRLMVFRDDAAEDQEGRYDAISRFMTFFFEPENYIGWVSMEGFLPVSASAAEVMTEADDTFEVWLDILENCRFYPVAKAEWDVVKQGIFAAEQSILSGVDSQQALDRLQEQALSGLE